MEEKDPSPFGYTFTGDFFGSPTLEHGAPPLLNDMETQEMDAFFSQTPWDADMTGLAPAADAKDLHAPFVAADWGFVPPPTIHGVSTTIPNQPPLHGFGTDSRFASSPQAHLANTADDLQAASTLFNNVHMAPTSGRAYSFHGLPPDVNMGAAQSHAPLGFSGIPMVAPSTGHQLSEQMASLLPHHDEERPVESPFDASFAGQYASPVSHQHPIARMRGIGIHRPPPKRTYTYGTDTSFHESGFQVSSRHQTEDYVVGRLMHDMQHGPLLARQPPTNASDVKLRKSSAGSQFESLVAIPNQSASEEEPQSDEPASDEEVQPIKKRRKSKPTLQDSKTTNGARRVVPNGRHRKTSMDERASKKKQACGVGQKSQRENLSEEQKRSNHIHSEQKRRNLIKRGFDDLHALVPEIRNGGLSKSGVLTEAANFLEMLMDENKRYSEMLLGSPDD